MYGTSEKTDVDQFVLHDLTLDLCTSNTLPAIATPRSLDLAHLRTALLFHTPERIDRFVTMDSSQEEAAKELGLPVCIPFVRSLEQDHFFIRLGQFKTTVIGTCVLRLLGTASRKRIISGSANRACWHLEQRERLANVKCGTHRQVNAHDRRPALVTTTACRRSANRPTRTPHLEKSFGALPRRREGRTDGGAKARM